MLRKTSRNGSMACRRLIKKKFSNFSTAAMRSLRRECTWGRVRGWFTEVYLLDRSLLRLLQFALRVVGPFNKRTSEPAETQPERLVRWCFVGTHAAENISALSWSTKIFQIGRYYGHHRLAALRRMYPGTKEFDWIVRPLADGVMIQMRARENGYTECCVCDSVHF